MLRTEVDNTQNIVVREGRISQSLEYGCKFKIQSIISVKLNKLLWFFV